MGYLTTLFQLKRLYRIDRDGKIIMTGEWLMIFKDAVVAYYRVVFNWKDEETESRQLFVLPRF
jgi:hypothetical protein